MLSRAAGLPACVYLCLHLYWLAKVVRGKKSEVEGKRDGQRSEKERERELLFWSHNEPLIHREVRFLKKKKKEKSKTLSSSSLILSWWSRTGLFPVPNILHDRLSIYTAGLADPALLLSGSRDEYTLNNW